MIYFYFLFHHYIWFHCDRKRDEAKQCIKIAWRTYCNPSDVEDGILNDVIGSFNPFCEGDKDPKSEKSDQCVNYITPHCHNPDEERCPRSGKSTCSICFIS